MSSSSVGEDTCAGQWVSLSECIFLVATYFRNLWTPNMANIVNINRHIKFSWNLLFAFLTAQSLIQPLNSSLFQEFIFAWSSCSGVGCKDDLTCALRPCIFLFPKISMPISFYSQTIDQRRAGSPGTLPTLTVRPGQLQREIGGSEPLGLFSSQILIDKICKDHQVPKFVFLNDCCAVFTSAIFKPHFET